MKRFFRRKKQRAPLMYTGFQKMGMAVTNQQRKWADYLNGRTRNTSRHSKILALVTFCFLFGGSSVFLMVSGIKNSSGNIPVEKISFPSFILDDDDHKHFLPIPILNDEDMLRIQVFEKYMDSLKCQPNGKLKYDSICKARLGLMDSVLFLKQLFLQQSKAN